jgi:tRNA threonylcarbamoyladenosine biosynthesis protein TsaB
VALARAGEGSKPNEVEVIEESPLAGGTFSAQLVPQIAALLAKHGFSKADIGAFVVVSGPGSFTGLRVGLAAVKALAEILQKPIVSISLLEIVALASRTQGRVVAALDAGRGEVYVGEYEVEGSSAQLIRERLRSRDEFLKTARESSAVTPVEALVAAAQGAGISVIAVAPPDAAMIARLGWRKLQAGETCSPEKLEANYIRRTDAEIFAKPAS